ncbi:hypothetical protein [Octadecabacter sp. R77987]|uniref:hypothetical protein n=1 Tax=Octadecabacter sp. R77987 TaxID=3093874 RepID=UPI0036730040
MSEIGELEGRISAALDRIRRGVESGGAAAPAAGTGEIDKLSDQLAQEKDANAQLEARVAALKERQDGQISGMNDAVEGYRKTAEQTDRDLQRLRQVNAELRDINDQLRKAASEGVAEPHLINKAMLAELEALRASRAADIAEVDAVLNELKPLISEEGA